MDEIPSEHYIIPFSSRHLSVKSQRAFPSKTTDIENNSTPFAEQLSSICKFAVHGDYVDQQQEKAITIYKINDVIALPDPAIYIPESNSLYYHETSFTPFVHPIPYAIMGDIIRKYEIFPHIIMIGHEYSDKYPCFLLETLPLLEVTLSEAPITNDTYFFLRSATPKHYQILTDLYGISPNHVISSTQDAFFAHNLTTTSPVPFDEIPIILLKTFRNRFVQKYFLDQAPPTRYVLINREGSRIAGNMNSLLEALNVIKPDNRSNTHHDDQHADQQNDQSNNQTNDHINDQLNQEGNKIRWEIAPDFENFEDLVKYMNQVKFAFLIGGKKGADVIFMQKGTTVLEYQFKTCTQYARRATLVNEMRYNLVLNTRVPPYLSEFDLDIEQMVSNIENVL